MAIKFTTTKNTQGFIKCLVYGKSGIGKTRMAKTAKDNVIISSEKKLISLKDENIPVILVENHLDLQDAFDFITTSPKAKKFRTVTLDSISDIAESVLAYFKENPPDGNTHPQAAYGALADHLLPLIKKFRDIPDRNLYFIAKEKLYKDEYTGISSYSPMMPGQQLGPGLPYLFDFVFAMRMGETKEGKQFRYLQTQSDIQYLAKGIETLEPIEKPNLDYVFHKALGEKQVNPKKAEEKKSNNLEGGFKVEEKDDQEHQTEKEAD